MAFQSMMRRYICVRTYMHMNGADFALEEEKAGWGGKEGGERNVLCSTVCAQLYSAYCTLCDLLCIIRCAFCCVLCVLCPVLQCTVLHSPVP